MIAVRYFPVFALQKTKFNRVGGPTKIKIRQDAQTIPPLPPTESLLPMKMTSLSPVSRSLLLLVVGGISCIMCSGCVTTGSLDGDLNGLTQADETQDIFVLEYRGKRTSGEMKKYPLAGHVTVQQALEQAGLTKKLATCDLTLIRTVPGTQRRHKMKLDYVQRGRQVSPEHNYALHPNDHLVIAHASQNPIEAMLPGVLTSK